MYTSHIDCASQNVFHVTSMVQMSYIMKGLKYLSRCTGRL